MAEAAEGPPGWWGSRPGRAGVVLIVGGAALGVAGTVAAHRAPGPWLGFCLVASTMLAALAVRPGAVYRLIPLPPLAYLAAAAAAGVTGGPGAAAASRAALTALGAQWLASGFLAMSAASALAAIVAITRALRWRRRLSRAPVPGPPTGEREGLRAHRVARVGGQLDAQAS